METDNEYLITEEEFKTLDTDNIFEILLNDGTKLKFNKNTNKINIKILQEIVTHH